MSETDETGQPEPTPEAEHARRRVRRGAIPSTPEQRAEAARYDPAAADRDDPDSEESH
ncbi:hypothetical protein [Branchiibius cervicis]|uniref:Multidrug transporter n=1 Tax=Branchiibius cervicis TaxID=908252 RepID=A0ABW2AWS9_9MICO